MTIKFKNSSDKLNLLITESKEKTQKLENFTKNVKPDQDIRLHDKYAEQISENLASLMETNSKIEEMLKKKSLR